MTTPSDLARIERLCRQLADKIRKLAWGPSGETYQRIAQSYDMLADELAADIEKTKKEQSEDPDYDAAEDFASHG